MKIVGLSCHSGIGKENVIEIFEDSGYTTIGFTDPIKKALYALDPWIVADDKSMRYSRLVDVVGLDQAKKNAEVRRLLETFGWEVREVLGESDLWISLLAKKLLGSDGHPVFIPDVKTIDEAKAIKEYGGILIKIKQDDIDALNEHPSNAELPDILFDVVIENVTDLTELYAELISYI